MRNEPVKKSFLVRALEVAEFSVECLCAAKAKTIRRSYLHDIFIVEIQDYGWHDSRLLRIRLCILGHKQGKIDP